MASTAPRLSRRSFFLGAAATCVGPMLLWALLRRAGIGFGDLPGLLGGLRPAPLVLVVLATALQIALAGEKWRLVEIRLADRRPTRRQALAYSLIGTAIGQFLPPPLANALVRGGGNHLSAGEGGRGGALTSVWEQLFDFGVVLLLLAPSMLAVSLGRPLVFVVSAPLVLLIGDRLVGPVVQAVGRRLKFSAILTDPGLTTMLYRLSVLRFCLLTLATWAVAVAARFDISFSALAATIAPVVTASILSFLPAGIGVNEWSFLFLLGAFGAPLRAIAEFSLINRIVVASISLLLGLIGAFSLGYRVPPAKPTDA